MGRPLQRGRRLLRGRLGRLMGVTTYRVQVRYRDGRTVVRDFLSRREADDFWNQHDGEWALLKERHITRIREEHVRGELL